MKFPLLGSAAVQRVSASAKITACASSLGVCERLPACLGDLHARDYDRASADNHALAMCGGLSGAHKLNYLFDSEAMGEQDRLGAAVCPFRKSYPANVWLRPFTLPV